jgi:GDP-L-fucose synthase
MILVTGATGFLGKRVCKQLTLQGLPFKKTALQLGTDLRDKAQTLALFGEIRPSYVLNCAAYVGGIQFGVKHPAELFQNNLQMTLNLLDACKQYSVMRLVNPISNCAYPGDATYFKEEEFWNGPLHESVMVYGFVRKASWVGSWAYAQQYGLDTVNLILSNMYGPEDHFEEERSHALGALIMKFVEAQRRGVPIVEVWGSGKPVREWLYIDDGAEAMIRGMSIDSHIDPINIGVGKGISIIELAHLIKEITGYTGDIKLNPSKLDGAPFKTVDGRKGRELFGDYPHQKLRAGIDKTVAWYKENNLQ